MCSGLIYLMLPTLLLRALLLLCLPGEAEAREAWWAAVNFSFYRPPLPKVAGLWSTVMYLILGFDAFSSVFNTFTIFYCCLGEIRWTDCGSRVVNNWFEVSMPIGWICCWLAAAAKLGCNETLLLFFSIESWSLRLITGAYYLSSKIWMEEVECSSMSSPLPSEFLCWCRCLGPSGIKCL